MWLGNLAPPPSGVCGIYRYGDLHAHSTQAQNMNFFSTSESVDIFTHILKRNNRACKLFFYGKNQKSREENVWPTEELHDDFHMVHSCMPLLESFMTSTGS